MTNTYRTAEQWEAHARDYEVALREHPDDIEVWMNLTTLYWQATDPGVSAGNGMSVDFFKFSADRLSALLEIGRERFAGMPQAEFWTRFIEWAEYGRPLEVAECREWLARAPQFKDPALYILMATPGAPCDGDIAQLLAECRGQDTKRAHYIVSVIEARAERNSWLKKPSS
jgi:hypothetical protein